MAYGGCEFAISLGVASAQMPPEEAHLAIYAAYDRVVWLEEILHTDGCIMHTERPHSSRLHFLMMPHIADCFREV